MFRRLRLQFITIASLAILFILVSTVGIINTVRSFQTEQEISKVLNTLTVSYTHLTLPTNREV